MKRAHMWVGALWASRGEAVRGHIGPQFFPPAWTAKVSTCFCILYPPWGCILPIFPSFTCSHHVGGGGSQEGEKGDEDHKQKGKKQVYRNNLMNAKVDGGETVTETTTTMSRETSGTLGSKETSGSLGREENEQPLALRSKILPGNIPWEM